MYCGDMRRVMRLNHIFYMALAWSSIMLFSFGVNLCGAHSTPAELVDLSLEQLMQMPVNSSKQPSIDHVMNRRWTFSVAYRTADINDFQRGTQDVSRDSLLYVIGSGDPRTSQNYPVLSYDIRQSALVIGAGYRIDELSQVSVYLPYIQQRSRHISSVPGYSAFTLSSEGMGDVVIHYNRRTYIDTSQGINYSVGISLPVGSIDEEGDTPRAPGNQQMPYPMQLGSGTWDIPISIAYFALFDGYEAQLRFSARIRTERNDRDYRLGNRHTFSGLIQKTVNLSTLEAGLIADSIDPLKGEDAELAVPSPFPYPANIADPNNYGGKRVYSYLSLSYPWVIEASRVAPYLKLKVPLYQDLNGVQPQDNTSIEAGLQLAF